MGVEYENDKFDLSECAIHQMIETLEYVLGTISHTSSYLRLWALSLAHQQLSLVFFNLTIGVAAMTGNPISIYIATAVWFVLTVAFMMVMELMTPFLHTLRLHWVEFQSKFYRADGHEFKPFRHEDSIQEDR